MRHLAASTVLALGLTLFGLAMGCALPSGPPLSNDPEKPATFDTTLAPDGSATARLRGTTGDDTDIGAEPGPAAGYQFAAFAGERLEVWGDAGSDGRIALLTPALDVIDAERCEVGWCLATEVAQPGTWTVLVRAPVDTPYAVTLRASPSQPNRVRPDPRTLDPEPVASNRLIKPSEGPFLAAEWLGYVLDAGHHDAFQDAPVGVDEPNASTVRVGMSGAATLVVPTVDGMAVEARLVLGGTEALAQDVFDAMRALLAAAPAQPRPSLEWPVTERSVIYDDEPIRGRALFDVAVTDSPPEARIELLHEQHLEEHAVVLRVYGPGVRLTD